MLSRGFSLATPLPQFLGNVLAVSLAGLLPLLALYVLLIPGFAAMLAGGGIALWLFLRQVLTNGLIVVFAVNYAAFFLNAVLTARRPPGRARVLWLDPPLRAGLFLVLHGLIYAFSARWFGSFHGDAGLALRVVGPTLQEAAAFRNLSGVYLYATLGSALPIYAGALAGGRRPGLREGLAALALFAVFALILTLLAAGITLLQGG